MTCWTSLLLPCSTAGPMRSLSPTATASFASGTLGRSGSSAIPARTPSANRSTSSSPSRCERGTGRSTSASWTVGRAAMVRVICWPFQACATMGRGSRSFEQALLGLYALEPTHRAPLDYAQVEVERLRYLLGNGHHEEAREALGRIASGAEDATLLNGGAVEAKARRLVARCTELRGYFKNHEGV